MIALREFLTMLRDKGRRAVEGSLATHGRDVDTSSTLDVDRLIESV